MRAAIDELKISVLTETNHSVPARPWLPFCPVDQNAVSAPSASATAASPKTTPYVKVGGTRSSCTSGEASPSGECTRIGRAEGGAMLGFVGGPDSSRRLPVTASSRASDPRRRARCEPGAASREAVPLAWLFVDLTPSLNGAVEADLNWRAPMLHARPTTPRLEPAPSGLHLPRTSNARYPPAHVR
jgi:hypothetical protein